MAIITQSLSLDNAAKLRGESQFIKEKCSCDTMKSSYPVICFIILNLGTVQYSYL